MVEALRISFLIRFAVLIFLISEVIFTDGATTSRPRIKKTIIRKRKPSVVISSSTEISETFTPITTESIRLVESSSFPPTTPPPDVSATQHIGREHISGSGSETSILSMMRNTHGQTNNGSIKLICDAQCNPNECIRPQDCLMESVLDHCSCCHVCAAREGERCYNENLNVPFSPEMGMCGSNLNCKLRSDLETEEIPEALCQCRDSRIICGSDNVTYSSECKLREAAVLNPNLSIQAWNPCVAAPMISDLENVTAAIGDEISLSCEVRAFPAPAMQWEFLAESSGTIHTLPGDDPSVVITIRGGPELHQTSSWLQIISTTPHRQGTYFCIATNSEGITRKHTYVSVYNNHAPGSHNTKS